jgi:hypothetical protein
MRQQLKYRLSTFGLIMAGVSIDTAFLGLWLLLQWTLKHHLVPRFQPVGLDQWLITLFHIIFALGTLFPVLMYFFVDLNAAYVEGRQEIRKLKEKYPGTIEMNNIQRKTK